MINEDLPVVSVGIPTYNRPDGLRRTLNCITSQTYKNLEIIVSDNFSDNEEVSKILTDYARIDNRIFFIRQSKNIGAFNNFKFVLERATGAYFMWAADDDYWESNFIEVLISNIGNRSACFCDYSCIDSNGCKIVDIQISISASGETKYEQLKNFFLERIPSMIYGLYVRSHLLWFLKSSILYDWGDCFIIQKIILKYNGYNIIKGIYYKAGVRDGNIQLSSLNPDRSRLFDYSTYMRNSVQLIVFSQLKMIEKIKLLFFLIDVNLRSFISLERNHRKYYWLYYSVYKVYDNIVPRLRYKRLY